MKVSEAVKSRISCRSFLEKPVPETHLRKIIEIASLSPSGGNLQPWNLYVLTGKPLDDLKKKVNFYKNLQKKIRELNNLIKENAEYVGDNFTSEARSIHYDKKNVRSIYGKATEEETQALIEEGIEVNSVPWVNKNHN